MSKVKDGPVEGSNAWLLREVKRLSAELAELKRMLAFNQKLDGLMLKVVNEANGVPPVKATLFEMLQVEPSISDSIERFTD